jgi:hypothetical protein
MAACRPSRPRIASRRCCVSRRGSAVNKTVTVTLGAITLTGGGFGTGTGGASIRPASALTDPAGNAARPTARTMAPLF